MQPRCLRGLPKPERSEGSFFSAHLTMKSWHIEDIPGMCLTVIYTWRLAAFGRFLHAVKGASGPGRVKTH